jgi:endonuclease/exonuclease/phosphatase family metal-dependent hydrolase
MTGVVRLATWNVERPKPSGWKVPPAQRRRMGEVAADVWVLTETHLGHQPSAAHRHAVFSPPDRERLADHERWTAIWSRWPLQELHDPPGHRRGSVAAVVHAPVGPILVYGTVIAYANEPHFDDGAKAGMWQVHRAEIGRQGAEWKQLRADHPGLPMVVAGDFNQDRDGSGYYGTRAGRDRLGAALIAADLECVTTADAEREGLVEAGHLIDHICLTPDLVPSVKVFCWDRFDQWGQRLSDHPTVAVDFRLGTA